MDIQTIEGIGPVYGAILRNSGIYTVNRLLKAGSTERGRQRIADRIGVNPATILRWVQRGDLLRVKGIGTKYSTLLESAGVSSVKDLSTRNPLYLCETLKAVNKEKSLLRRSPDANTLEIWIRSARNLEPIIAE